MRSQKTCGRDLHPVTAFPATPPANKFPLIKNKHPNSGDGAGGRGHNCGYLLSFTLLNCWFKGSYRTKCTHPTVDWKLISIERRTSYCMLDYSRSSSFKSRILCESSFSFRLCPGVSSSFLPERAAAFRILSITLPIHSFIGLCEHVFFKSDHNLLHSGSIPACLCSFPPTSTSCFSSQRYLIGISSWPRNQRV